MSSVDLGLHLETAFYSFLWLRNPFPFLILCSALQSGSLFAFSLLSYPLHFPCELRVPHLLGRSCGVWFCLSNRGVCVSPHQHPFLLEAGSEASAVLCCQPLPAREVTASKLLPALAPSLWALRSARWAAGKDQTKARFRRILVRTIQRDMAF